MRFNKFKKHTRDELLELGIKYPNKPLTFLAYLRSNKEGWASFTNVVNVEDRVEISGHVNLPIFAIEKHFMLKEKHLNSMFSITGIVDVYTTSGTKRAKIMLKKIELSDL